MTFPSVFAWLLLFGLWLAICTATATATTPAATATATTVALPMYVDTVHLLMMNHLDVGFDGIDPELGYAANVVNKYFDVYFPLAINVGINITKYTNYTFTWMTHAWLISMFMDCPPNMGLHCPTQQAVDQLLFAIHQRYIAWHAFPFNSQQEVYDRSMLDFGLYLSRKVSMDYNASVSKVLSQRDVPGITRSIIPHLLANNISAISVGVNDGSAPPAVPSIFKWVDTVSHTEIIAMWHPGGYGGTQISDAVLIENFNHALVMAFKGDNSGPPTFSQVLGYYAQMEAEYPNAAKRGPDGIFASTFTMYVDSLLQRPDVIANLTRIDQEIGDTWIHGISADPYKTSVNRLIQRERAHCLYQETGDNQCSLDSYAFYNFSRLLLKNGEHTWGGDIKKFLDSSHLGSQYYAWSNEQLRQGLLVNNGSNNLTTFRSTWHEQRHWGITYALQALSLSTEVADQTLYQNIMHALQRVDNVISPLDSASSSSSWIKIDSSKVSQTFRVHSAFNEHEYAIQFDAGVGDNNGTGAILSLIDLDLHNTTYASPSNMLGEFIYQSLTETDFDTFIDSYSMNPSTSWVQFDFGKKGLDANAHPKHQYISATFAALYQSSTNVNQFLVEMNIGSTAPEKQELYANYGIPDTIFEMIDFSSAVATFSLDIVWLNKSFTRIPEVLWLKFNPLNCKENGNRNTWMVSKFGEMVDVRHIVNNGSFHMHASTANISCGASSTHSSNHKYPDHIHKNEDAFQAQFAVDSIDTGLAAFMIENSEPKEFTAFPVPFKNDSVLDGMAFVMWDNIWGTNYPVWYPFDAANANVTMSYQIYL